jgi:hypothetical protein
MPLVMASRRNDDLCSSASREWVNRLLKPSEGMAESIALKYYLLLVIPFGTLGVSLWPRPNLPTKGKRRARVDHLAQRIVHRARGERAHARHPVGVAVEAERLPGGM